MLNKDSLDLDEPIIGMSITRRDLLDAGNLRAFKGSLNCAKSIIPDIAPDKIIEKRMNEISWNVKEWSEDNTLQDD